MKKFFKSFLLVLSLFSVLFVTSAAVQAQSAAKPVTIYLVRHGQTTGNVMDITYGWSDYTLTENGINGAKYVGLALNGTKFNAAYTSDLTRQEKTAHGILDNSGNKKVQLQIDQRLREVSFGSYEGLRFYAETVPQVAAYYGYKDVSDFKTKAGASFQSKVQDAVYALDQKNTLHTNLPAEYRAESSQQLQKRMTAALTDIAKNNQEKGGNVLIVSSGMAINAFLAGQNFPEYTGFALANESVTKLIYENGKFRLDGPIGDEKYFNEGQKLSK